MEPLTRALLETFVEDGHDSTYGQMRSHAMSTVRDATEMQVYMEVVRLSALGAIESRDRGVIPGDTNRMRYGITEIGRMCLRTRTDPADGPDVAPMTDTVVTEPPTAKQKRKRKPTPDNWEW